MVYFRSYFFSARTLFDFQQVINNAEIGFGRSACSVTPPMVDSHAGMASDWAVETLFITEDLGNDTYADL